MGALVGAALVYAAFIFQYARLSLYAADLRAEYLSLVDQLEKLREQEIQQVESNGSHRRFS